MFVEEHVDLAIDGKVSTFAFVSGSSALTTITSQVVIIHKYMEYN